MTTKVEYLGIEWTQVHLNPLCMKGTRRTNGYKVWTDYSVPDEMWIWLRDETGDRYSSQIADSEWWWDRDLLEEQTTKILFHFKDPNVALKFKLTWGTVFAV